MILDELQKIADELKTLWKLDTWTITVQFLPESERETEEGRRVYGVIDHYGNDEFARISINPQHSDSIQKHTLYHEMMHLRLEGHDCQSFYERGVDILSGELCG